MSRRAIVAGIRKKISTIRKLMNIQITLYAFKRLTSVSVGIFIPCEIAPTICKEIREKKITHKINFYFSIEKSFPICLSS